jgi:hypothetical protein
MQKRILLFIVLYLVSDFLSAQKDSVIIRKEYFAQPAAKSPKIDGNLDDIAWNDIPATNSFTKAVPTFNIPVTQQTEVKIIYDNTAIYVSAMLFDTAPDSIAHQLGNRDDYVTADMFQIKFDTYNKEQDGFIFGVSASGVQVDNRFSDPQYNAVWESAVKINDKGWCVEIKIPFSALRFPNVNNQIWGLQITRNITRNGEFDQWALTPKDASNSLKYWGLLKGINNIKPPLRLSLTPYITAYTSHYPANVVGQKNYSSNIAGGMDLKYGINESFTVDMTLLPDFTQVQSDNVVKNLGAFEVLYGEQRPFFQEGTDLFQKGDLFYSRRIGRKPSGYYSVYDQTAAKETIIKNPDQAKLLNATKISGRTPNGLGVGVLNAVLDNTYAIARDSTGKERKILTEPFSNYNIVVFDQQLKNSSSVYLINTNVNRQKNYNTSDITGAGFNLNNKKSTYALFGQAAVSNVLSKTDSVQNQYTDLFGYKYDIYFSKISGRFQFVLYRDAINQTFNNNDMGITRETNFINNGLGAKYVQFEPRGKFLNSVVSVDIFQVENFTTHQTSKLDLALNYNATLRSFYNFYISASGRPIEQIDYYEARTPGRIFIRTPGFFLNGGVNSDSRKRFTFGLNFFGGSTALISPTIGYNPYYGISLSPSIRVNDKLSFQLSCDAMKDDGDRGYVNKDENGNIIFGKRIIHNMTNVLAVRYLFRNNLSLSLRGRHYWSRGDYVSFYNLKDDGHLMDNISYDQNHDFNVNAFNVDMLFQWQFAPGSFITLNWKNSIYNEGNVVINNYADNFNNTLQAKQLNTFSLKVLYYFDYLYLVKKKV